MKQVQRHVTNDALPPARGLSKPLNGAIKILDWKKFEGLSDEAKAHIQSQVTQASIVHSQCPLLKGERLSERNNDNVYLHGQRGAFAKQLIEPHTFVGFYAGTFLANAHDATRVFMQHDSDSIKAYLFACDPQGYPCISAFGDGNTATLINDYRPHNFAGLKAEALEAIRLMRMNCDSIIVGIGYGVRIPAFFSTTAISEGQQLWTDYGQKYWADRARKAQINMATRYRTNL